MNRSHPPLPSGESRHATRCLPKAGRPLAAGRNAGLAWMCFILLILAGVQPASAQSFPLLGGSFAGVIYETDQDRSLGITVQLSKVGGVSGTLTYQGVVRRLNGRISLTGAYATEWPRRGAAPLRLEWQVFSIGGTNEVLFAKLIDGSEEIAVTVGEKIRLAKGERTPEEGNYNTLVVPLVLQPPAEIPAGNGFLVVKILGDGQVRYAGKLADGTPVSGASILRGDGQMPFFSLLYKKGGSLRGYLSRASAKIDPDVEGLAYWTRPADAKAKLFAAGFNTSRPFHGYRYTRLERQAALELPGRVPNVQLTLQEGDLETTTVPGILAENNRYTPEAGPLGLKLAIATATGLLKGSFIHPTTGKRMSIFGITLRPTNYAAGYFLGPTEGGDVRLEVAGAQQLFFASPVPVAIPDNAAGVTATIAVPAAGTAGRVRTSFFITHPRRGDLTVTLRTPSGRVLTLKMPGDDAFDGNAALVFFDHFVPGLADEPIQGDWQLNVQDSFPGSTGTLDSWTLDLAP